jgi:two-component system sensor histidine kinase/response regulator
MLKRLNDMWLRLIGSAQVFSLESRIFHSISMGLMVLAFIYIPYNFFAGLFVASVSAFIISAFILYQYYYSRFHGRAHSNMLFGLLGMLIFGVNYFTNSGINGSTDLIWPAYLLLVFAIAPYRQHIIWLGVYLLGFGIIHIVEYYHPELVKHPFTAGKGQFIDRITAFPIPAIAVYIIIKFLRRSYDKERLNAHERALAIEAQNQHISLQKNQLEQSNNEKSKLLSVISHDMRAPLITIQNYLELLNENELDSQQRPALERDLLTATNSTMDMLTNLLQWSRSQMEGPRVNLQPVNLRSAIQSTLGMAATQAAKKDIVFSYHIPANLMLLADADMLQLVVRNLVSNAIKFTPLGGTIKIDAQQVHHECKITVSDTGKGIDKQKQDKIFSVNTEPAFGTNNEKGVGLGLLLCKEFIERQGGRIGFESVFGRGSNFFIFIAMVQGGE